MQSPDSHDLDIAESEQVADLKRRLVEAKETIEELRSHVSTSGERFQDDDQIASEWHWEMGPDLRITWFSAPIEASMGRPGSFYLGKKFEELGVPVGDLEKWTRQIEALTAHRAIDEFTFWRIIPDGQSRCLTLSAKPQFGSNGKFLGYRGTTRDITELLRREKDLRETEQRYALAIAGTHDGIWERNYLTGAVYRSPRWYQILGYEPGDLDTSRDAFYELLPPEDAKRCRNSVRAHIETRAHFNASEEYRIRCKSGEYIWITFNAQAEWDEDGKPVRMAGSISDITERKRV
jgi:PAS domain S-box-containing protein